MQVFRYRFDDGIHQRRGRLGARILKNKMSGLTGNDLVAWQKLEQLLVEIIEGVFNIKWSCAHRYDRIVHQFLVCKINIEDPGHNIRETQERDVHADKMNLVPIPVLFISIYKFKMRNGNILLSNCYALMPWRN